jgi:hypothetical protein
VASAIAPRIGVIIGLLAAAAGIAIGVCAQFVAQRQAAPKEPLAVRLDSSGPYTILATRRGSRDYARAIERAKALHPAAVSSEFDPTDLGEVEATLRRQKPRYALVFIEPDELDVNFAWSWLKMACRLDDDPFVDVRTGFVTGVTPAAVDAFVVRIADAAQGRLRLPGALVDDLGPPEMGDQTYFNMVPRSDMLPALGARVSPRSIFHGKGSFTDSQLGSLDGAGLVHFGGHGHPDRIDDGLAASQLGKLKLAPCIVFNGACFTGVTGRWYDQIGTEVAEKMVAADESFCLKMLFGNAVAYLAALHPDHGMPVYQEMEYLSYRGGSLGDVIKHTYDGIVVAAGGKMPDFEQLKQGMPRPQWRPADFMLKGTAARVLFGDPALVPCDAFAPAPFAIIAQESGDEIRVTATLANLSQKNSFTDTYWNDLNSQAPFNDRALLVIDLPSNWASIERIDSVTVKAGGVTLPHRVLGHAIEIDQEKRRLHVQVDVPATGFQQSAFRVAGATVELVVHRGK